jgi:di/tricarboxylate transporter
VAIAIALVSAPCLPQHARYFFAIFAGVTANATMLPLFLAVGATIPGMRIPQYALLLSITFGLMGSFTPYGTGPSPACCG